MWEVVSSAVYVYTLISIFASTLASATQGETERMRRLTLAVVLACALSGIARAGEIPSTGVVTPPPPPPRTSVTSGENPSTGATTPQTQDTVLTIILTLISIVR